MDEFEEAFAGGQQPVEAVEGQFEQGFVGDFGAGDYEAEQQPDLGQADYNGYNGEEIQGAQSFQQEVVQEEFVDAADGVAAEEPAFDEDSAALTEMKERLKQEVAERDAKAEELHAGVIEEAVQHLQDYYTQRDAQLVASKQRNRENEEDLLKQLKDVEKNPWERVVSLIDLRHKDGEDAPTRMKSLLLQVKAASAKEASQEALVE